MGGQRRRQQKRQGTYQQQVVTMRMVIPFTMVCEKCNCFNNVGKKLNMKMYRAPEFDYEGVKANKFIAKCVECSHPFSFHSAPETGGYELDSGGKRAAEPKGEAAEKDEMEKDEAEKAKEDQMTEIQMQAEAAARQLEENDRLEALLTRNRRAGLTRDQLISRALDQMW